MPSSFWSFVLEAGDSVNIKLTDKLILRNACLGHNRKDGCRSSVLLRWAEVETIVCSLIAGQVEHQSLKVGLEVGIDYTLSVIGANTVYLSGNYKGLIFPSNDMEPPKDAIPVMALAEAQSTINPPEPPAKRKRGRPPGSKNKTKSTAPLTTIGAEVLAQTSTTSSRMMTRRSSTKTSQSSAAQLSAPSEPSLVEAKLNDLPATPAISPGCEVFEGLLGEQAQPVMMS